jgi:transposase-like protein
LVFLPRVEKHKATRIGRPLYTLSLISPTKSRLIFPRGVSCTGTTHVLVKVNNILDESTKISYAWSMKEPRTLQEAILYFADADNCLKYMANRRWPNGVSCPTCGRTDVSFLANQRKWQCKSAHAKRQFTAKVGTIFEDSPLGLEKWLPAIWIITTAKNGVSSYKLSRSLGVTQKTAWFMLHRIREALRNGSLMKIGNDGGPVEIDETFTLGPNTRKMHASKRLRLQTGSYAKSKMNVFGMLDRESHQIRAKVVPTFAATSTLRALRTSGVS